MSKMNVHMFSSSPGTMSTQNGNLATPIPKTRRSVSNELSPQPNGNLQPSSPNSPNAEGNQWSSAVGLATTNKSGRVIEKLMADKDKLQRELKTAQTKTEELGRSVQAERALKNDLHDNNEKLRHAQEVDKSLISRRDRQINDLKEDLRQERDRRLLAEEQSRKVQKERDEAVEARNRDVGQMMERMTHAETHSSIMQSSHQQLRAEYTTRTQAMRTDIETLQRKEREDAQKMARLEVVYEQMRQNHENMQKAHSEMVAKWDELKAATDQKVEELEEVSNTENERTRKLSTEMDQVVNQMRWIMGVKKNTDLDQSS